MRHWLLILMIALLPIRSWMGDAMAVAMAAAPVHGAAQVLAAAAPSPDSHADHASHTSAAEPQHAGLQDQSAPTDHGTHTHKSCEVCNGPALPFAVQAQPTLMPVPGMPAPRAERFASAEPHRGIKPPIS